MFIGLPPIKVTTEVNVHKNKKNKKFQNGIHVFCKYQLANWSFCSQLECLLYHSYETMKRRYTAPFLKNLLNLASYLLQLFEDHQRTSCILVSSVYSTHQSISKLHQVRRFAFHYHNTSKQTTHINKLLVMKQNTFKEKISRKSLST